jgi:hypothetical protein
MVWMMKWMRLLCTIQCLVWAVNSPTSDKEFVHGMAPGISPGSGMDDDVLALTVYNSNLIAGGRFTQAGGYSADDCKMERLNMDHFK